jgi:TIR domain
MTYNLTSNHKEMLRKFVSFIKAGEVDEEFHILWDGNDASGWEAMLYGQKPGKRFSTATPSGIDALVRNGLLSCQHSSSPPLYAITGKAYEAVESDFSASDIPPTSTLGKVQANKEFFVSYNNTDRTWAEWIAWVLEDQGYSVIIQAWDFRPGGNFILDMQRATAEAKRTIMVLSDAYLQALYTQPEWAAAFKDDPTSCDRKLLPVRVAPCKPKGMLAPIVYVDLVGKTEAEAEELLLAALQERAKPTSRPTFPKSDPVSIQDQDKSTTVTFPGTQTDSSEKSANSVEVNSSMTNSSKKLSAQERLKLIKTLNALPTPQFDEIVFALQPPSGNIPGNSAPQGNRSKALLEWLESPIGQGLSELDKILESIIAAQPEPSKQSQDQTQQIVNLKDLIEALGQHQAPKYDLRGAQFAGGFAETVQGDQTGGNLNPE